MKNFQISLAVGMSQLNKEHFDEVNDLHLIDSIFTSNITENKRNELIDGWKKAIKATLAYK